MDSAATVRTFSSQSYFSIVGTLSSWLVLCAITAWSIKSLSVPAPIPQSAPPAEFSAARAFDHVQQIARAPHPVGSAEHDRVRDYIVDQITKLGLQPQIEDQVGVFRNVNFLVTGKVANIVARIPGSASTKPVLLMAHYDSVERAPGAGDDTAGVATLLETARALTVGPKLRNDIVLLFTDGEEVGLLGAQAAAQHDPWMKDVGIAFNFDNRGVHGPDMLFETSAGNHELVRQFAAAAPHPVGSSLFYTVYKQMDNDTDFTELKPLKIPGLNFGFIGGFEDYHSRLDAPDRLDLGSLQQGGGYALALANHFGNSDLSAPQSTQGTTDDVFFNLPGNIFVHYSGRWVLPTWAALSALLLLLLVARVRAEHFTIGEIARGLASALSVFLLTPICLLLIAWIFRRFSAGHLQFGDTPANFLLVTAFTFVALACFAALFHAFRGSASTPSVATGGLVLFWTVTTIAVFTFPLASYLLFWPLVFAVVSFAFSGRLPSWISAIPAVVMIAPMVKLVFVGFGLTTIFLVVLGIMLSLFALLLLQLWDVLVPPGASRIVIVSLAVVASVLMITGVVRSHASIDHPVPDTLSYAISADQGSARWISLDEKPDPWTRRMLTSKPEFAPAASFTGFRIPVLSSPAPYVALPAPTLESKITDLGNGQFSMHLRIASQRSAPRLNLQFADTEITSLEVAGISFQDFTPGESRPDPRFRFVGFGSDPTEIDLRIKPRKNCRFWLSDQSFGMPEMPGRRLPPRPADRIAWYGSDVVTVTKTFTSCTGEPTLDH